VLCAGVVWLDLRDDVRAARARFRSLRRGPVEVSALSFDAAGRFLAVALPGRLVVFDAVRGVRCEEYDLGGLNDDPSGAMSRIATAVAFSADARTRVVASDDAPGQRLAVFDGSGAQRYEWAGFAPRRASYHSFRLARATAPLALSMDGRWLAVVRSFDAPDSRAYSPRGASAVELLDASSGRHVATWGPLLDEWIPGRCPRTTPRWTSVRGLTSSMRFPPGWRAGRPIERIDGADDALESIENHGDPAASHARFSEDGRRLVVAGQGVLEVRSVPDGALVAAIDADVRVLWHVLDVAPAGDAVLVAFAGDRRGVLHWEISPEGGCVTVVRLGHDEEDHVPEVLWGAAASRRSLWFPLPVELGRPAPRLLVLDAARRTHRSIARRETPVWRGLLEHGPVWLTRGDGRRVRKERFFRDVQLAVSRDGTRVAWSATQGVLVTRIRALAVKGRPSRVR